MNDSLDRWVGAAGHKPALRRCPVVLLREWADPRGQFQGAPVVIGRLWRYLAQSLGTLLFTLVWSGTGLAQSGISQEGPLSVFRTGGTNVLLTIELPFLLPETNALPVLKLDFGFATAEPDLPNSFFDSFSVTLQGTNSALTALLLTSDRTGVQWTPPNPGGMTLAPADVGSTSTNFPALLPDLAFKIAYSIAFAIPAALAGAPATLFLDLFDNLDGFASLAWVGNVRVDSIVRNYRLFSAPAPGGPYTEETSAVLDEPARLFRLSPPTGLRFFRVQADRPVRINSIQVTNGLLAIRFTEVLIRVQTATSPRGSFADDDRFVLDAANRRFVGPLPASISFFRIAGDQQLVIKTIRVLGNQLIIEYEEVRLQLLSAPVVTGPYLPGPSHFVNPTAGTITLAKPVTNQFYRVQGNARARLSGTRIVSSELVLDYVLIP